MLTLTGEASKKIHYMFFESQSETPGDDPLLLWLNGGPGCSSMFSAFYGNGPFRFE